VGAAEALGGSGEDRLGSSDRIVAHVIVPDSKHRPSLFRQPPLQRSLLFTRPPMLTTARLTITTIKPFSPTRSGRRSWLLQSKRNLRSLASLMTRTSAGC
jgi:hypothetical protein